MTAWGVSIQTIRELRLSGQGGNELDLSNPGNPDGKIIESTSYDANSRVAAVADDKGNATAYGYDSQNRLVLTIFADGSGKSIEYNADSQPIRTVDNNGNIILASFDSLGRVVRRDITPAAGVKGTTVQTFEYDGLSRVTKAGDNNDPANSSDDSLVQRHYDSLGRLLEESQNGKVVSYNWSQTADPVDLTYPNGRKIEYSLDQLNRLRTIKNNGSATTIAAYDYIGNRLIERVHANGTRLTTLNDAGTINQGYDGLGRLTQIRHLKENTLIAGFGYGYNRENIKSYRQDLKYPHLSELYHYDSRYRLVDFQRGTLNASKDGITGAAINSQTWQLDGVGNWASTVVDGQSQTQTISNMNAYLSFAGVTQTYDTNGNLTNDGNLTFAYDFANRMVEIRDNEDNSLIASYSYDAFNRRISKTVQSSTVSQGDTSGSEYQSDRRTIALYHFNNSSGPIVDSSGNGNNAGPRKKITTVAGLYGTNAAGFSGKRLTAPASSSLDSITDKLTVEAWVYIQPGDDEVKCRLVHRQESFILKIRKDTAKAVFKVFIDQGTTEPIIARAVSDSAIPMQTWVHLAGVYNGKKVKLFVNGVKQRKKTAITGNVHRLPDARLVLGSQNFHGRLEEVRISNKARRGFPGVSTSSQQVLRHFFYAGWTCIEEREQAVLDGGSFGPEKLTRQFVDGANIDEHICVDYYADDGITVAKTYFYHANHRGDIVALTDAVGAVVLELRCSAYGQAAKVDQQGLLQEFDDFSLVVFGFQSRRLDEESFLYHFRSRQYNPVTGRFCQRDGLGYVDGYNLYLAFRGAPVDFIDPYGEDWEDVLNAVLTYGYPMIPNFLNKDSFYGKVAHGSYWDATRDVSSAFPVDPVGAGESLSASFESYYRGHNWSAGGHFALAGLSVAPGGGKGKKAVSTCMGSAKKLFQKYLKRKNRKVSADMIEKVANLLARARNRATVEARQLVWKKYFRSKGGDRFAALVKDFQIGVLSDVRTQIVNCEKAAQELAERLIKAGASQGDVIIRPIEARIEPLRPKYLSLFGQAYWQIHYVIQIGNKVYDPSLPIEQGLKFQTYLKRAFENWKDIPTKLGR